MGLNHKSKVMSLVGGIFAALGTAELIGAVVCLTGYLINGSDIWIAAMILGIQAVVFGSIGYGLFLPQFLRTRKRKRLMEAGERYDAEVVDIYYNENISANGMHPLNVECRYTDGSGRQFLLKSANLWLKGYAEGEDFQAEVYVNPDNPQDYHVEVTLRSDYRWEGATDLR